MANLIQVIGRPVIDEQQQASAAFSPGHLVEIDTLKWRKHSSAAKNHMRSVAMQREERGLTVTDAYATNDNAKVGFFGPGMVCQILLKSGVAAVLGETYLESAGDGTLQIQATDAATDDTQRSSTVGVAWQTVTASGETLCKVRIL